MAASEKMSVSVPVPSEVEFKIEDALITLTGPKGSLSRAMSYPGVKVEQKDGSVVISAKTNKKAVKAILGTFGAHLSNMVKGVTKGFEYRLKTVFSHFPITVKQAGSEISINNFLGEKTPRKSRVLGDCKVSIKGASITVTGINIEDVAQTAANIELATKVKGRDRRVFQDGIYLVGKGEVAE
jgi:large subunit ribosomal protein L6